MGRDKSERSSSGSVSRFQGLKNLESGKLDHLTMISLNQGKASERSKTVVSCLKFASDIKTIKKILNPLGPFSGGWDTIFLLSSVIAVSLDPLFFYLPVVNENKKCLFMDRKLGIAAMVLRSVMDGLYIISVTCPRAEKRSNSSRDAWSIAMGYGLFLIDIISVLPLPQVVVLVIIPMMRDVRFLDAMNLLTIVVICQFIPRILRIYPLFKRDKRTSATLAEATWAKAAFNLFLFMLAGHAVGALLYFLAIERETTCWQKACANHIGCVNGSFYCNDSLGNHTFINDSCPISNPDPKLFDFGIFLDALQAGVLEVNFPEKFFHCFRWGLQNLSCFGQNLRTSTSIWENCFALFITISGLLLFLSLIGNVQIYLQSKTIKLEELRLRNQEIEQWKPFKTLPEVLQKQIKKHQRYKWQESRGVDVEKLLRNLPKDLRRDIKRHLCLALLMRVPMFEKMDEQLLDAMCDRLKWVLYTEESYIVREGDPVDGMLFIMQGKLLTLTNGARPGFINSEYLAAGDFCGEELLTWALNPHSSSILPISTRTVRALIEVEAFALMADDLKFVTSQFRRFQRKQLLHTCRYYSQDWRTWAAYFIQTAWRRYSKKKLAESLREEENRLQDALANVGGSSLSLGATIYASRFAANALRRNRTHKARVPERVPPILLQKPAEPDFTAEEQ